jgi:L-threonylcarbamoyladenylate synthase
VYGLGANATNEQALLSIYATKRRPLSDPIIVHVLNQQQALNLAVTTVDERKVFLALTDKFWPGPLTVILKANLEKLPLVVTAGTGFVGLRSPKQPTARKLIELSGLPIGAPSANLFGHVSPTEPIHVFNDFYDQDVAIIDGERCEYGLESTVVKMTEQKLSVLRQGSFTTEKLKEGLKGTDLENI